MIRHPAHTSCDGCVKSHNSKRSMLWAERHIFTSTRRHHKVSSLRKLHWLTPHPQNKNRVVSTHWSACSHSTQQASLRVPGEVLSFWAKQLKIVRWHTLYVHVCLYLLIIKAAQLSHNPPDYRGFMQLLRDFTVTNDTHTVFCGILVIVHFFRLVWLIWYRHLQLSWDKDKSETYTLEVWLTKEQN